ncbi:MAG: RHS repeat protein, partial [Verrucomicrobia bacterium]|nr:RHS repeat protein [Verrucomicrobiota bacterium]
MISDHDISEGRFVLTDFLEPARRFAPEAPDIVLETPALAGGEYFVWARVYAETFQQSSAWFSVNGESDLVVRAGTYESWDWVLLNDSGMNLESGPNSLQFKVRDPGFGLDAVIVTDDASFLPAGSVPVLPSEGESWLMEAEAAQYLPEFFHVQDETQVDPGTLSTLINSMPVGDYDIWIRVRSVLGAPLFLFWDEAEEGTEVVFDHNSAWTWVKLADMASVSTVGDYALHLVLPEAGLDIDALIVTDDSELAPDGVTQPDADPGTFWLEAESFTASAEILEISGLDANEVSNSTYVTKNQLYSGGVALSFHIELQPNRTVASSGPLHFPLDFEESGQHYLWARVRVPFPGRDSVWVSSQVFNPAAGTPRQDVPWTFAVSGNEWEWVRFDDASLNFQGAGDRRVSLRFREGGVHIDRVIVTTDDTFTPVVLDAEPAGSFSAFEAEEAGVFTPFIARSSIRQIRGSDTLVDILPLPAPDQGYSIKRYLVNPSVTPEASGIYDINPLGDSYSTTLIRNPDPYDHVNGTGSYNQLEIVRPGGNVSHFTYNELLGNWTLITGGGLNRLEREDHISPNGLVRTTLRSIYDAQDNLVEQYAEVFQTFAFGERRIERVRDPEGLSMDANGTLLAASGQPAVDTWSYYTEPGGSHGKIHYTTTAAGSWTIYEYDEEGRPAKEIRQYKNSAFDDEPASRVITFEYENPGFVADGLILFTQRVEKIQEVEVSRRYTIDVRNPENRARELIHQIQAVVPGAAWDDPSNLVTKTYHIPTGTAFAGRVSRVERPDGTGTTYAYSNVDTALPNYPLISIGDFVVEERTGAMNSSGTVIDGTETITYQSLSSGTRLLSIRKDIASGLVLDETSVLDVDHFGRAIMILHGDGSISQREYAGLSCGCGSETLKSETDRQGITTEYAYDVLDRRISMTRLGVTEHYELDAQGRTIRTIREAGPETLLIGEIEYDLAGRVVEQRTPGPVTNGTLVTTATTYEYPSTGGQVVTTTYPDGGTRIETLYPDGQTRTVTGTAAAPMKMDYGTFDDNGTAGVYTRQILLRDDPQDPGNYLETEWTESRSVMGRQFSIVFPDGASQTVAYDNAGRVIEQVDPDGVTTRFAYDSRGRRYLTAQKTSDSPGIDLQTDRVTEQEFEILEELADFGDGPQFYTFNQTKSYIYQTVKQVDELTQVETEVNVKTLVSTSLSEVNGRGSLSIDIHGNVSRQFRTLAVDGDWEQRSYSPSGAYSKTTYVDGLMQTTSQYDADETLLSSTSFTYDAFNRQAAVTDSRTGTTSFEFYDNGQVREITAPDPDGAGPLSALVTTFEYDDMGRQVKLTKPDDSTVHTQYDLRGQVVKTWGSQTNPVEYTYDDQGRMLTLTTWKDFDP